MQTIVESFLQPPHIEYSVKQLGPRRFMMGGRIFHRNDFDLVNDRHLTLKCSLYEPDYPEPSRCMIYCHGNCGNRIDSLEVIDFVLPKGLSLCSFDFCGSGQSSDSCVSFGLHEQRDIDCVVQHLHKSRKATEIVLWGRSMGAVAALLYASSHHFIRYVVADSPFSNLRDMCVDVIESYHIPSFLSGFLMEKVRKRVLDKAGFCLE